jgi:hypothetical protein
MIPSPILSAPILGSSGPIVVGTDLYIGNPSAAADCAAVVQTIFQHVNEVSIACEVNGSVYDAPAISIDMYAASAPDCLLYFFTYAHIFNIAAPAQKTLTANVITKSFNRVVI